MKKTVTALLLGAALIPVAVFAGSHFGDKRDGHRLERMTETLQLSEQQQAEVQKIFQAQREKRQALREESRNMIDAVLSEEQRATLAKYREERRKRFCDRKGGGEGHQHGYGHHREG
jgi:Spy/CpxP family protein refolding chaperone